MLETGPDRTPAYEKAPERAAWLRRVVPGGQADKAVGEFLGELGSRDVARAVAAYEQEAARLSEPSDEMTGTFVRRLGR